MSLLLRFIKRRPSPAGYTVSLFYSALAISFLTTLKIALLLVQCSATLSTTPPKLLSMKTVSFVVGLLAVSAWAAVVPVSPDVPDELDLPDVPDVPDVLLDKPAGEYPCTLCGSLYGLPLLSTLRRKLTWW